jgi:hypothetical protein
MRGSCILACAVCLSAVVATKGARAQESYNGLVIGPMASEGRRWGWGAEPGATIGGLGVFGGARLERWRIGLFEQNIWWVGSHGVVLDFGGFIGLDWASLWLDPQLSAALFSRIEPALRFKTNESVWALAPSGVVGGRLFGVEIGFLATPEIWLSTLPNNGNKLGVDLQVRLSCDLVELTHLVQHLSAAGDQPTP